MKLEISKRNGVTVISLSGSFDASVADDFKKEFEASLKENDNFVIDLNNVQFVDSTGLGRIVSALRKVSEKKGDLKLAGINDEVMIVFQITRAYKIFDIYDDVDAAVKSFK